MSWIEKTAFLVVGLGSILYFLVLKIKEQGIALEGGILVILALIMLCIALCCGRYLCAQDKKRSESIADKMRAEE